MTMRITIWIGKWFIRVTKDDYSDVDPIIKELIKRADRIYRQQNKRRKTKK